MWTDVIGGDEDNYGQEMAMYLHDDDVIKPSRNTGIRRFCTPATTRSKVNILPYLLHSFAVIRIVLDILMLLV